MNQAFIRLTRVMTHSRFGTFGVLKINEYWMCVTLERYWMMNKPNVSSIPAGQYMCYKYKSPRFGDTWIISNVPGRSYCLFHPGNLMPNTEGCVLVAEHFGKLKGDLAVLNSGETFKRFIEYLSPYDSAHLTVSECY